MKQLLLLIITIVMILLLFIGCNSSGIVVNEEKENVVTENYVECTEIKIVLDKDSYWTETYDMEGVSVYEYISESGNLLYLDYWFTNTDTQPVQLIKNRAYKYSFEKYTYVRAVGPLLHVRKIYVDTNNKKVKIYHKYTQYTGSSNGGDVYKCVKKNFYLTGGDYRIFQDECLTNLEYTTYVSYEGGYVYYKPMNNSN